MTLYVTTRGLSTGPMPARDREAEIASTSSTTGSWSPRATAGAGELDLVARPACADVYAGLLAALATSASRWRSCRSRSTWATARRSPRTAPPRYDPDAVHRFWRVLAMTQRVLDRFRGGFAGKASPVHLFWHSFDLAHARYSGRATPVPGAPTRSAPRPTPTR